MSKDKIAEAIKAASPEEEKPKSKYSLPTRKIKLSPEESHDLIMKLLIRNKVDIDKVDSESIENVENCIDIVKEAVMYGDLKIYEEDGELKVRQNIQLRSKDSTVDHIIFGEVRGLNHRNVDNTGNAINSKLSLMALISETPVAAEIIDQMRSSDIANTEALGVLFL